MLNVLTDILQGELHDLYIAALREVGYLGVDPAERPKNEGAIGQTL